MRCCVKNVYCKIGPDGVLSPEVHRAARVPAALSGSDARSSVTRCAAHVHELPSAVQRARPHPTASTCPEVQRADRQRRRRQVCRGLRQEVRQVSRQGHLEQQGQEQDSRGPFGRVERVPQKLF